ncbi:hypothetical protein GGS24DRAFT_266529 [Hypoxylon argillaceum]|nr:hypothetical protein GGS24DRAFT_266529 [Hypoxylon argillaceum]
MIPRPAMAPLRCIPRLALSSPTPIPALSSTLSRRALSTTAPLARQTPSYLTVPADQVPDYPYGRFTTYKQRNQGLYGRAKIRFGNVVAHKYGNKSRTTWLPNRQTKRLWSPALRAFVRTRLTASVLRTIDRLGGIDEYLLGAKAKRLRELGPAGWALRWKVMQTPAVRERFARERAALGLPPKDDTTVGAVAAASADGFPDSLAADGLPPQDVLDDVDAMLARDEEFVIGSDSGVEAEEVVAREDIPQPAQKTE